MKRRFYTILIFTGFLIGIVVPSSGQLARFTNPTVYVEIDHPPGVSVAFERVAFAPPEGDCADEFMNLVEQAFFDQGVDVVDRASLETLFKEHDLSMSDYADPRVAEAAQILGPTVYVIVRLTRCATEPKLTYRDTDKGRVFISTLTSYIKGNVRLVELATSRVVANRTIDRSHVERNEALNARPELPSEYEVIDVAMRLAAGDIHHLLFPWSERRSIVFYNDNKCNLKTAYQYLKIGDRDSAMAKSKENLDTCNGSGVKPKTQAHARYNVGVLHFLQGEYEEAIAQLRQAHQIKGSTAIAQALAQAQRAQRLAHEVKRHAESVERQYQAQEAQHKERRARSNERAEQSSVRTQLLELKKLLDEGLISQQVYERRSEEILAGSH